MTIKERGLILEFASEDAPGPTGTIPPFSALKAIANTKLDESAVSPSGLKPTLANLKVQLAYQVNGQGLKYRPAKYLRTKGNAAFFEASFPNLSAGNKVKYYFRILGLGFPFPSSPSSSYMVNFEVASSASTDPGGGSTPTTGTGPIASEDPVLEEGPSGPTTGPFPPPELPLVPPVLLFPLKLETRFVGRDLWIRFVPDPVLINQLTQHANEQELQALSDFETASEEGDDKKAAWRALVQKVGVYRAAWLIRHRPKEASSDIKPIMQIAVLPDQFDIFLYTNYEKGRPLYRKCEVKCGKTLEAFQKEKPWEVDFPTAIELGLGQIIDIRSRQQFDRIIVVGRRADSSTKDLSKLLDAHRYTQGFSFLPWGTPTNNTEGEKTPFSSAKRQDADTTYDYLVESLSTEKDTWAGKTAAALGLSVKEFEHDRNANQRPEDLLQALKTILWWPLGHYTIQLLMGGRSAVYNADVQEWLRDHYERYVHTQGPLSALQIGRNPYGLLPVARIKPIDGDDELYHFRTITQRLVDDWLKMIKHVPKTGDNNESILQALAMQPKSTALLIQKLIDKKTLEGIIKDELSEGDDIGGLVKKLLTINNANEDLSFSNDPYGRWDKIKESNKKAINSILTGKAEPKPEDVVLPSISKLLQLISYESPATLETKNGIIDLLQALFDQIKPHVPPAHQQKVLEDIKNLDRSDPMALIQAFTQALDLNAYRLDAWITSAATRLLADYRKKDPNGLQLGVFGWVENLKRDADRAAPNLRTSPVTYHDPYPEDGGGFIHAPSTTQATAAALAKSAFLANQKTEPENAFALNLLSDRIQGAQRLHDGIRHGQDIAALLGYAFERRLHDLEADQYIAYFRQEYPFVANKKELDILNVVDGVKLLKGVQEERGFWEEITNVIDQKKIKQAIHYIDDVKDASADSLHFEALFQAAQGNHERAAAALDAFQGEGTPPILDSLRTPPQGSTLNYKFLYCLSGSDIPRINYLTDDNVRAAAEPVLENWLRKQLGDQEDVTFQVKVTDPDNRMAPRIVDLNLRQLHLGYLDLLMLAETTLDLQQKQEEKENAPQKGISGLEQRVIHFIRKQETELTSELSYKFIPEDSEVLKQFWTLLRYLRRFLLTDKSLLPQHILPSSEAERAVYVYSDWYDVYQRVQSTAIFYEQLKEKLDPESGNYAPAEFARSLERVARFGIKEADRIFGEKNPEAIAPAVCKAMTNAYSAYEAAIKKCKKVLDLEKDVEISSTDEKLSPNQYKNLFDHLDTAAKALFGPTFRIIRPVRFPKDLDDFLQKEQEALIGFKPTNRNGQERIREWLQGLADIYPEMKTYEDAQLLRSAWGKSKEDYTLQIAQYTPLIEHRKEYPWVALNEDERAKINGGPPDGEPPYPPGTFSMVIEGPENFKWEEDTPLYLLPIWEGRDAIPQTTRNTGISFQYDAPNAEPPQSLLLAVPELGQTDWKKEDLRDIVNDTLDLAKARLVDIDALKELGFLFPATLIGINTNESAGETSPPKPPFDAIQVLPRDGTGNLSITDKDDVVVEVAPNDKQMYLKLSGGPGKVAISLYGTDQGLVRNQMITLPQRKEYTIPIRNRNIRYLQFKRVAGRQSITLTKIEQR